jgi:hypothetical protein
MNDYCKNIALNGSEPKFEQLVSWYSRCSAEHKAALWKTFLEKITYESYTPSAVTMHGTLSLDLKLTRILAQDQPNILQLIEEKIGQPPYNMNFHSIKRIQDLWVATLLFVGVAPNLDRENIVNFVSKLYEALPHNPNIVHCVSGASPAPDTYGTNMMYLMLVLKEAKQALSSSCRYELMRNYDLAHLVEWLDGAKPKNEPVQPTPRTTAPSLN